jgi:Natural resistance-associated macrophage protein
VGDTFSKQLTGTLAGQIVMEGFLQIRLKPRIRQLITRLIAILPTVLVIGTAGEGKLTALLIFNQVVLSFQLPFAVIPLERAKMGGFVNSRLTTVIAWGVTAAILFFQRRTALADFPLLLTFLPARLVGASYPCLICAKILPKVWARTNNGALRCAKSFLPALSL